MSDVYFIKDGYRVNPIVETMDHLSGEVYWTQRRITEAGFYQHDVYKYLLKFLQENSKKSLVDIGCGVAPKLAYIHGKMPGLSISGVDQVAAIAYCKASYSFGKWIEDDFEDADNYKLLESPDVIVSSDVIEHLANPDYLLSYIKKIARSDTHIVLSTPERDRMRGEDCCSCPQTAHIREWNAAEFAQYVTSRGFRVIDQVLVPAFRYSWRRAFLSQDVRRILKRLPRTNNQVLLMRLDN